MIKKRVVLALASALLGAIAVGDAAAQSFPSKPITIVVPFPPGAGPDVVARTLGERLSSRLGQPVIVENRAGAAGMLGVGAVARAAPDGHTITVVANTLVIAPHVLPQGATVVDITKELAPIVMAVSNSMTLTVNPQLNVNSVSELVALAKAQPGLAYASGGNGSPMHIVGELFKRSAGIDLTHVPYKGVAPSITDTISGQVKVLWVPWGGAAQNVRAGRLKALALADTKRSPNAPGVPSMAELGYKDVVSRGWLGVLAPGATPRPVVDQLNREINAVLALDEIRDKMASYGFDVVGGSPELFAAEMRDDYARYGRLAKEFNIKAD